MIDTFERRRAARTEDWRSSDSGVVPFPQDGAVETYRPSLDPGPRRTAIARLRDSEIEGMDREALIEVIQATAHSRDDDRDGVQLEHQALEQLRRLAFLSRRCCRNQVNTYCAWRRQPLRYKAAI